MLPANGEPTMTYFVHTAALIATLYAALLLMKFAGV
jgi:hypothetical protein